MRSQPRYFEPLQQCLHRIDRHSMKLQKNAKRLKQQSAVWTSKPLGGDRMKWHRNLDPLYKIVESDTKTCSVTNSGPWHHSDQLIRINKAGTLSRRMRA